MSSSLPISIQMGALPAAVKWTPQQLADAMVARMSLVTAQTFALFVTGSTAPLSNVGPWLKNGTEWYIWDVGTGAYIPITIPAASLGYWIGSDAPDPLVYSFWIETAVGGSPLALKIYYGGGWVDVYDTTFASYLTIAAAAATYLSQANAAATYKTIASFNADIAAYLTTAAAAATYAPIASPTFTGVPAAPTAAPGTNTTQAATTAFVTAAIAAIPAPSVFAAYPGKADKTAQVITADGTPVKIALDTAIINPAPAPFDVVTNNRYVAPADGFYLVTVVTQFDNVDATAAGMRIIVSTYVNGADTGDSDQDNTPTPNGGQWTPSFSTLLELNATDYIEVFADVADGVGTGTVLCDARVSVHRVQA